MRSSFTPTRPINYVRTVDAPFDNSQYQTSSFLQKLCLCLCAVTRLNVSTIFLLFHAHYVGNTARVETILEDGASLDGSEAHRPLITAVFNRHQAITKLLLEKGADVNAGCKIPRSDRAHHRLRHLGAPYDGKVPFNGETPLHIAAFDRITPTVRMLLAAGANPNAKTRGGTTPLMGVASQWFAPNAKALLEAGADPLEQDLDGLTALHHASLFGITDAARWLASIAPSTINTLTPAGRSALHFAAREGHTGTVSCLLVTGCLAAVVRGHVEVVRVMLADGLDAIGGAAEVVPLAAAMALTFGARRILRMVLDCTGEENRVRWIHASRAMAGPLLHYAAGYIVPGSISALLEAGADATATDAAGQRAIDVIGTMDRDNPPLSPLHPRVPTRPRDPDKEAEIRRTLLRAPAFRAVSHAWPAVVSEPASSSAAPGRRRRRATPPVGVRVYRPVRGTCLAGLLLRWAFCFVGGVIYGTFLLLLL